MANLYANVAHVGTGIGLERVFDMITVNAARLLCREHDRLEVGAPATLVLFDAHSGADAVARLSPAITGWKNGRQTFLRPAQRSLFGQ